VNRNALVALGLFALLVSFNVAIIMLPAGPVTLILLGAIALTALALMIPLTLEHRQRMRGFAARQKNF
jgi:hypothetical protein